ncbi:MAG TPA: VWA domain-containing protein [Blastocatellia bacterium]|nr:VWA domain-containing protein [Blastocatellia bacterium]
MNYAQARCSFSLAAISLLLISVCALAQQAESPAQEIVKVRTELVTVDAQVTDKKTREIVRNLRVQDFELFEDDAKQQIEYFSQDKLPLSIVLLLDISPSVRPVIEEIRNGALQALQQLKPEDEIALMVFSGWTELIQDFTKDRALILSSLGPALEKNGSGTLIHEAIAKAARQFKHATIPNSRRVVIVITDNQGSMSRQHENISEAEVRDAVIESGATFCGVISRSFINLLDGIMFQHPALQEVIKRTSVNPYVELSGGEMTAASKETINIRLSQMIDRLRHCYSLGYTPTSQDFNGRFRRIRISLTPEAKNRLGGECVINARRGYYAIDRELEQTLAEAGAENSKAETASGPAVAETKNDANAVATSGNVTTPASDPAGANLSAPAATRRRRVVNPLAHLITLDVQALSRKTGAAVTNLGADDFEVEDNSARQPLVYFRQGETPLSLVLLVDVAGNTGYALSALRRSARFWLSRLGPVDEIALMAFSGRAALVQDFTRDHKVIASRLRNFTEDARKLDIGGGQDRVGAVFQAVEQLDKTADPLGRRVIVVVTDDTRSFNSSVIEPVAEFISETSCSIYALVARGDRPSRKGKVTRAVVESALLSFGNPVSFAVSLGTRLGTEVALDTLLRDRNFTRLVSSSGGTLSRADGEATSEQMARLLEHLQDRYVIGFSPVPHTSGDRFHKLKLKLKPAAQKRTGDVVLVTAHGYFARQTESSARQNVAPEK